MKFTKSKFSFVTLPDGTKQIKSVEKFLLITLNSFKLELLGWRGKFYSQLVYLSGKQRWSDRFNFL